MPYVDYSSKQVQPLMSKEEILEKVGVHQTQWRLQRKRHAVRVEFVQSGSLGVCEVVMVHLMSVYVLVWVGV